MTAAEIAARVAEMRSRQGLPPTITDPATLARVAAIITAGATGTGGGR